MVHYYLLNVLIAVKILTKQQAVGYGTSRSTISNGIGTHVLEDYLTVIISISTRVLVGPLHGQCRPSVIV